MYVFILTSVITCFRNPCEQVTRTHIYIYMYVYIEIDR